MGLLANKKALYTRTLYNLGPKYISLVATVDKKISYLTTWASIHFYESSENLHVPTNVNLNYMWYFLCDGLLWYVTFYISNILLYYVIWNVYSLNCLIII